MATTPVKMATTLTIDQGNSAAKVAVWLDDEIVETAVMQSINADELRGIVDRLGVTRAIYCSVAEQQEFIASILAEAGVEATEMTQLTPTPLAIDYSTPLTLGVDRLAAAVGAASLYPGRELLVVDAGTAVTYDRVTARGHFAGGNIAPGVGMRLKALHAFTARLPLVSSRGETRLWGNSTESAMRSGAFNGVVAEISYYRSRLPQDAMVVVAGGWGRDLVKRLDFEADYREYLVNRGLNVILKNI